MPLDMPLDMTLDMTLDTEPDAVLTGRLPDQPGRGRLVVSPHLW